MKSFDAIVIGAGIIGLSTALSLRKQGMDVLLLDRAEPGQEASWAAGGMLAPWDHEISGVLRPFAEWSERLFPEFVHELQDESGQPIDLREQGTIVFPGDDEQALPNWQCLGPEELTRLEPGLGVTDCRAFFIPERSVDPRSLTAAAVAACKHRGVHIASGSEATHIEVSAERAIGVRTARSAYAAGSVVNCAGAWAGSIAPLAVPTRPVKGQMLALIPQVGCPVQHVLRRPDVYIIPRSDGRIMVGATVEEAADKRVIPETIQRLHQSAARLAPELGQARIHEAWAGLRPGSPDDLPIIGASAISGYYIAAGHYRNGILMAPATAAAITALARGKAPEVEMSPLAPARFGL